MKKPILAVAVTMLVAGCYTVPPSATAASGVDSAIKAASDALSMAQSAGGEWKVLDSATGGSAQPLSKLLKIAKEKAAGGETEEAVRLANKVATFAELGTAQSKGQMGAKPYY